MEKHLFSRSYFENYLLNSQNLLPNTNIVFLLNVDRQEKWTVEYLGS